LGDTTQEVSSDTRTAVGLGDDEVRVLPSVGTRIRSYMPDGSVRLSINYPLAPSCRELGGPAAGRDQSQKPENPVAKYRNTVLQSAVPRIFRQA